MRTLTDMKDGADVKKGEGPACSEPGCGDGCGGPGICPGVALFLAWMVGAGVIFLSGLEWLGWAVGGVVGLVLITGAWKWRPRKS